MSLLSREHIRIGLCPDRLALAYYRGRWRPTVARKKVIAVESSPGATHWQQAVDALPSALGNARARPAEFSALSKLPVR